MPSKRITKEQRDPGASAQVIREMQNLRSAIRGRIGFRGSHGPKSARSVQISVSMASTQQIQAPSLSHPEIGSASALVRRALRWGAALVVTAAAAAFGVRAWNAPTQTHVHFQSAAVNRGALTAKITASGTLSALVTVSVGSQVSGRIQSLSADFGVRVTKGQVIARIEPSFFRAAVAQARANHAAATAALARARAQVKNAEKQFLRSSALYAASVGSEADKDTAEAALGVATADVDAAKSTILQARAALEQAELNLRYATIVSPIDGIVISRNVDVGQTVAATLQAPTLFSIAQDLAKMQVDTNVAEADVGRIHAGMGVTFTVDAYPTVVFQGKVRQVRDNAQTIQNVVTYDAVIDVDNSSGLLKPGMTASVSVVYAERSNAVRVPNAALRFRPDTATLAAMPGTTVPATSRADDRVVWVLRGDKASPLVVQTGISDGTFTEVVGGGVSPGELAVLEASVDGAKKGP
jgi:HlyD family secretion protein